MFITFEGIDGTGKTTQAQMLSDYLYDRNIPNILTFEPGATDFGKTARSLALEDESLTPEARLFLFMADRAEHLSKVVLPALNADFVVICDRYVDSTVAYQGYGQGLNISHIKLAHELIPKRSPDLTFLLDAPAEFVMKRLAKRDDKEGHFDQSTEFIERVRFGLITEMNYAKQPNRWRHLDARLSAAELSQQIVCAVKAALAVPKV
jgi:dTMP kinase